jgi:hypothetical protein
MILLFRFFTGPLNGHKKSHRLGLEPRWWLRIFFKDARGSDGDGYYYGNPYRDYSCNDSACDGDGHWLKFQCTAIVFEMQVGVCINVFNGELGLLCNGGVGFGGFLGFESAEARVPVGCSRVRFWGFSFGINHLLGSSVRKRVSVPGGVDSGGGGGCGQQSVLLVAF